ncbi:hypothetical protein ABI260_20670 [Pseudomonas guguanensis]|uniref:hypothetical protein n=1 Tax=Ectopseudomonas guguanensis TaxID=1198456 RepID=UPI003266B5F3
MSVREEQLEMWRIIRDRLRDKKLQTVGADYVSTRVPGTTTFWFASSRDAAPALVDILCLHGSDPIQRLHAKAYEARSDVCAIASGCGTYGGHLLDITGELPVVFDEQARHLGRLSPGARHGDLCQKQLSSGTNVLSAKGQLLILGMTGSRLILNAELFEKCANAYVLAAATGKPTEQLPWIVRFIANRRLLKDEKRALARVSEGRLPEETKGY